MKYSIIGAGVSGQGLAFLAKRQGAEVFVSEQKNIPDDVKSLFTQNHINFEEGGNTDKVFENVDEILISSGIPPKSKILLEAQKRNIKLTGELDFVLPNIKTKNLICVTGSNGKSTVTSLIGHILTKAGLKTATGGNLGTASSTFTQENFDAVVLELSSFQLARAEKNFHSSVSIITNLAPDHIDWHGSYENYVEAKSRVLKLRDPEGIGIIQDRDFEMLKPEGKIIVLTWDKEPNHKTFGNIFMADDEAFLTLNGKTELLFKYSDTDLIGSHNLENVAMSLCAMLLCNPFATGGPLPRITGTHCLSACGEVSDLSDGGVISDVKSLLEGFKPLPHRCELAGIIDGVKYIDDSKGTNVAATVTAMKSIKGRKVIILGGQGKGEDYTELANAVKSECDFAVLIGEEAPKIQKSLETAGFENFKNVSTMEDAVKVSHDMAKSGMVVLLSPACTSWDMYKSYKARGEHFCKIVKEWK
ncbi:MAG: UDP-N-acetylmuramoyl-L-alanine--D-glutamate ligase [Synergistaceae bacterium]|nr:UDP-N-acetylmuramoyl-L-alanine--D-glutamate ligase [Synergistaceae bacterium]MBR0233083.1 UDP-N-acetylmuramoyl-L-alanine--D-glutamate ligase [Synergistaceae bacterium]